MEGAFFFKQTNFKTNKEKITKRQMKYTKVEKRINCYNEIVCVRSLFPHHSAAWPDWGPKRGGLRVRQIGRKLQLRLCTPEQKCRLFGGPKGTDDLGREDHIVGYRWATSMEGAFFFKQTNL